jgi:acyl-CoA hydrolase
MMQWITQAGTMAASRVARGSVLLGAMDDIDFLHPVKVGEIAILRARVEYIGTSSLEVGVRVWAENVGTGQRAVTLNSHLVFVAVDAHERPCPVGVNIEPRDAAERALVEGFRPRWGRKVLEIRPPLDTNKGTAIRGMLADRDLRRALVAGDDTTDLDAFRGLDGLEHAVRIAVVSAEAPPELAEAADLTVGSPEEMANLLRSI